MFKKIFEVSSSDEVKQIFKEEGLELTDEQIENIKNALKVEVMKLNDMSDKELEKIEGGLNTARLAGAAKEGGGYGAAYGLWWGAGIGAAAGVVDASIKAYKGGINNTWQFMKEAFKTAVKSSLVGGATGAGLGLLSGTAYEIGEQGKHKLSQNQLQ